MTVLTTLVSTEALVLTGLVTTSVSVLPASEARTARKILTSARATLARTELSARTMSTLTPAHVPVGSLEGTVTPTMMTALPHLV